MPVKVTRYVSHHKLPLGYKKLRENINVKQQLLLTICFSRNNIKTFILVSKIKMLILNK